MTYDKFYSFRLNCQELVTKKLYLLVKWFNQASTNQLNGNVSTVGKLNDISWLEPLTCFLIKVIST